VIDDDADVGCGKTQRESEADTAKSGVLKGISEKSLERIKTQMSGHRSPQCYDQGTFWIPSP